MYILCSTVDSEMSLMIIAYTFLSTSCVLILKHCEDLLLVVGIFHCQGSVIFFRK